MPGLSIEKFDALLEKNGMIMNTFYVDKNMYCIIIEICITENDETCLIRIPSKYKMRIQPGTNVFMITELKLDERGTIISRYVPTNITDELSNINEVELSRDDQTNDIEEHIAENYNRPINLNTPTDNTNSDIFRQIKRLTNATFTMKYKLCIHTNDVLYYIDDDNKIKLFKHLTVNKHAYKLRKICVIININNLVEKLQHISRDIHEIKKNVLENISRNITKNIRSISSISPNIDKKHSEITSKLTEYKNRLVSIQKTVAEVEANERKLLENKISLQEKRTMDTGSRMFALNKDLEHTKQIRILNEKLKIVADTRKELFRNILSLKNKHDNILLHVDSIVFDTIILMTTVNNNIQNLMNII